MIDIERKLDLGSRSDRDFLAALLRQKPETSDLPGQVLLDALDALGHHRDAIVLVGAQAVYLHVGDADLAVTPYTTDGDLVIDPAVLAEIPPLERALMDAGFYPKAKDSVGVWLTTRKTSQQIEANIGVDLLVPASVGPDTGRRAARLPGHDLRAARIVRGLEGAIVDADVLKLSALDEGDARTVDLRVAGPAALLVAKVHKVDDRGARTARATRTPSTSCASCAAPRSSTSPHATRSSSATSAPRKPRVVVASCSSRSSPGRGTSASRWRFARRASYATRRRSARSSRR